jgi:hypothetical protein
MGMEFKKGDKVRIIDGAGHYFHVGGVVTVEDYWGHFTDGPRYDCHDGTGLRQLLRPGQIEPLTPEIDLTAITTPFGLLPEEVQRALKAHGGPWDMYVGGDLWFENEDPEWCERLVYRVRPEPPKPVVKDVPLVVWVDGVKTRTTWTFTDGQMTPTACVEVLK